MNKQRTECHKVIPTSWAAVYFMPGPGNFFVTDDGHRVRLHIKSLCVLYRREATHGHASTALTPALQPCLARVFREAGQAAGLAYLLIHMFTSTKTMRRNCERQLSGFWCAHSYKSKSVT